MDWERMDILDTRFIYLLGGVRRRFRHERMKLGVRERVPWRLARSVHLLEVSRCTPRYREELELSFRTCVTKQ